MAWGLGKHRKLKNFIINPRYQLRFLFWAVFACGSLIFYNTAMIYTAIRRYHEFVLASAGVPVEMAVLEYNSIVMRLVIGSCVILLTTVIVGIVLSHRTAGPLYSLNQTMKKIKEGDLAARARFRPNDEFRELADSFNEMMDSIDRKS